MKGGLIVNEKMIPSNDNLLIIKELNYVCSKCKKIISGHEVEFQKMPNNFNIGGLSAESEIPKCPYCGNLAFFGMTEAKGSGL
jgi:DNA-directed RNA polymerase subunit RPC12/RpoP